MENVANIPYSSAANRNRQPILDQLRSLLPRRGTLLEIGSGTGQHAVFFSHNLPDITWQPTDRQENLAGLEARFSAEAEQNILPPLKLDVIHDPWPARIYDAAYSANTAHIMSWEEVIAMFAGVVKHLATGARFCLYGPFNINGCFTSESNEQFDFQLRAGNPHMGIRDMAAMVSLANDQKMQFDQKIAMPANNFLLVFSKS
jgi:cyclopropane fatty-acyl-phospholipid synthase-like methyltransferase